MSKYDVLWNLNHICNILALILPLNAQLLINQSFIINAAEVCGQSWTQNQVTLTHENMRGCLETLPALLQ